MPKQTRKSFERELRERWCATFDMLFDFREFLECSPLTYNQYGRPEKRQAIKDSHQKMCEANEALTQAMLVLQKANVIGR